MKKLYVGNLSYQTTDEDLMELFSEYGEVASATIIRDKFTKQSKGFGFVEMANDDEAFNAIKSTDGVDFNGRNLKVSEARERAPRENSRGGSGGGHHRGGNGGGGGNRRRQNNY